ncbi:hypothetical protein B0H16DRAFT_1628970 [Mycena metata]|uniref:Uncharacterized protein n=1 Tax=Mycena metata TaxID=1033252 RepID=A0AAD7H4H3_9AGAR|nr:hypothetical protein B0H16DRAFT_1628970 [Mycena metata]
MTHGATRNWPPAAPDLATVYSPQSYVIRILAPPTPVSHPARRELDLRVKHADAFDTMLASALGCLDVSTKIQTERTAQSELFDSREREVCASARHKRSETQHFPVLSNESLLSARDDRVGRCAVFDVYWHAVPLAGFIINLGLVRQLIIAFVILPNRRRRRLY